MDHVLQPRVVETIKAHQKFFSYSVYCAIIVLVYGCVKLAFQSHRIHLLETITTLQQGEITQLNENLKEVTNYLRSLDPNALLLLSNVPDQVEDPTITDPNTQENLLKKYIIIIGYEILVAGIVRFQHRATPSRHVQFTLAAISFLLLPDGWWTRIVSILIVGLTMVCHKIIAQDSEMTQQGKDGVEDVILTIAGALLIFIVGLVESLFFGINIFFLVCIFKPNQ